MRIYSNNIVNGYFQDQIGNRGPYIFKGIKPNRSFHLCWQDIPEGTKSLALTFIDHDAIPVCGFSWIHWTIANIDPNLGGLPENASLDLDLLEGVTSWASGIIPVDWKLSHEEATGFGGAAPPDQEHQYTIELYALDADLDLQRGFYLNALLKQMQGHVLEKATLTGLYKSTP